MSEKQKITILTAKDLDISFYKGSGAGGQARNKVSSACMIRHQESGAIGRCSESRSQLENKTRAFRNLCAHPKMKLWLSKKIQEIRNGESEERTLAKREKIIQESVDKMMESKNLKIEVKNEQDKWEQFKE